MHRLRNGFYQAVLSTSCLSFAFMASPVSGTDVSADALRSAIAAHHEHGGGGGHMERRGGGDRHEHRGGEERREHHGDWDRHRWEGSGTWGDGGVYYEGYPNYYQNYNWESYPNYDNNNNNYDQGGQYYYYLPQDQ